MHFASPFCDCEVLRSPILLNLIQSFISASLNTVASVMKAHAANGTSARIAVMLMGTVRVDFNFFS